MIRSALIGTGALAVVVAVGAVSYNVGASGVPALPVAQPESEEDMQAMMAEWAKYAEPGKHHDKLGFMVGEWNAKMMFPMMPDMGDGNNASMTAQWVMGGRFVKFDFEGAGFDGKPFTGLGYTGYNNVTDEYVGIWMDTMSTGIYYHTGQMASDAQTLTMTGESATPQGPSKMKFVTTIQSDNKFTDTFYETGPDGEWMESGKIVYTRVGHGMADD